MSNTISTDYTAAANIDTYPPGALQGYRLLHWLKDILLNFCSDPINIKDDRLCGMFMDKDNVDKLFRIGVPFSQKSIIKAGNTPAILVSITETTYPLRSANLVNSRPAAHSEGIVMYQGLQHKTIQGQIAVVTESYDGTLLLANIIEDFLLTHEVELVNDCGMISQFSVLGSTGPQEIAVDAAGNAKQLFQATLQFKVLGGISWQGDTQGPVFRGLTLRNSVK